MDDIPQVVVEFVPDIVSDCIGERSISYNLDENFYERQLKDLIDDVRTRFGIYSRATAIQFGKNPKMSLCKGDYNGANRQMNAAEAERQIQRRLGGNRAMIEETKRIIITFESVFKLKCKPRLPKSTGVWEFHLAWELNKNKFKDCQLITTWEVQIS